MNADHLYHDITLPPLSDEASVEILNFLEALVLVFDARYGNQVRRYYDDRSQHNIVQSHPTTSTDDPPF